MSTEERQLNRREFIYGLGTGLGGIALGSLLACDSGGSGPPVLNNLIGTQNPLDLKVPELIPRAKACIFLMLQKLNEAHQEQHPQHSDLGVRMENYELAFKMQMEVPELMDLDGEDETTKKMYGLDDAETAAFGRKCLLARRLVEKGVRFVQLFSGGWDSHDFLERAHCSLIRSIDRPITALITDLKRRGLLEETLVVWTGEFGRTPDNGLREGGIAYGRDHNVPGCRCGLLVVELKPGKL